MLGFKLAEVLGWYNLLTSRLFPSKVPWVRWTR